MINHSKKKKKTEAAGKELEAVECETDKNRKGTRKKTVLMLILGIVLPCNLIVPDNCIGEK
jgi:hypothetical protein